MSTHCLLPLLPPGDETTTTNGSKSNEDEACLVVAILHCRFTERSFHVSNMNPFRGFNSTLPACHFCLAALR